MPTCNRCGEWHSSYSTHRCTKKRETDLGDVIIGAALGFGISRLLDKDDDDSSSSGGFGSSGGSDDSSFGGFGGGSFGGGGSDGSW